MWQGAALLPSHKCSHWCRVRRALENTAAPLGGDAPDAVVTYGRGLIQVLRRLPASRTDTACLLCGAGHSHTTSCVSFCLC